MVSLRMPPKLVERLKSAAKRKGTGYQTLMRELLEDAVQAEKQVRLR